MVVLFDLAGADGRRFSPNCWRTRMALAHKGLAHEARATRFCDIAGIGDGTQKTLPVIDDGGRFVADSWTIAEYLDTMYPERPSLFGGVAGHALTRFIQSWSIATLHVGIINLILCDIHDALDPVDQDYFRASREKRFGKRLEEVQAGREERVHEFRKTLQPLRTILAREKWLGGDSPLYADYCVFGPFQWAWTVSGFPILDDEDIIRQWFERCLDLYDGLGRRAIPALQP
jgi:glutathione S-transferase